jgi:hypothetical protein
LIAVPSIRKTAKEKFEMRFEKVIPNELEEDKILPEELGPDLPFEH